MTTNEDGAHTETGRAVVEVVPNKEAETLARIMKQYIMPGSTVYTDGASMYSWLDKFPEMWRHLSVLHAKGQFSKKGPQGELVSTNGIEGLFSRMKRLLRTYRAAPSHASQYGDYLGEFVWRMRFLRTKDESWRRNAFWHLMRGLRFQYKHTFVEPACRWQPPENIKEQVEAWQGEARLPRPKRPGGRFGKRPRPLAIEDGLVEEAVVDPGPQLLALEDVQPDAVVLVPPPRKRQRVGCLPPPDNAVVEEDDASLFTPDQVLNTVRCEARVWGGGLGGAMHEPKELGLPVLQVAWAGWRTIPWVRGWSHSPKEAKGVPLSQIVTRGGRPVCGGSGLLLEAWDVQTWGQSGRLGEVWKSERSASESMSLVFGLIVWKRGGGVAGQQISRGNECCKTGVLSTFDQKKSLQT